MGEDIAGAIEKASVERVEPGRTLRCLSIDDVRELAREFGLVPREVSAIALDNGFIPLRYLRNIGTLGTDGQAKLLRSMVAVIGVGGIGGVAASMLARSGVGTIVLVDPDDFDETNLNRQRFATEKNVGARKVDAARDRLIEINSEVEILCHALRAGGESLPGIITGAGAVIDALDSLDDRLVLQEACREAGAVLVHGAIAGTCLQAATIYPDEPGLECILRPPAQVGISHGIEDETGNPSTTPAIVAGIQVQEAVNVMLGRVPSLRGRLLYLDISDWTLEFIEL